MGGGVGEGTRHRNSRPERRESSESVCGLLKSHSTLLGRKSGLAEGQGLGTACLIKGQSPFDHLTPLLSQGFGGSALDTTLS